MRGTYCVDVIIVLRSEVNKKWRDWEFLPPVKETADESLMISIPADINGSCS